MRVDLSDYISHAGSVTTLTGIIAKLQQQLLESQKVNQSIQKANESLLRHLTVVERTSISNAQYARRESLELHGVPAAFDEGSGLEAKVINLMNDIAPEAHIVPADVQAIHRLKKRDNVIIKFVSRKKKQHVITKRASLRETAIKRKHGIIANDTDRAMIYLNESMCTPVKKLFYLCKLLKKKGNLHY